jgi:hypothetical protein
VLDRIGASEVHVNRYTKDLLQAELDTSLYA